MKKHFCGLCLWTIILLAVMPQTAFSEQTGPGGAAQFVGDGGKATQTQTQISDLASVRAESSAYMEEVLNAASRNKKKPYLYQKGQYLIIGNDRVAAVFHSANNELAGIVDIYNGGYMLAYGNGPIWKMTLAESAKKPAGFPAWEGTDGLVEVTSPEAGLTKNSRSWCGAKLTLTWDNISVADEKNILSVRVTVSAEAGSAYLKWNITVDNRSTSWGLWQVDFPRIESIVPMGDSKSTGLFIPWNQGRVIEDPFGSKPTPWAPEKIVCQYPAPSAPMQYSAIYGTEGGIFLAAHDGQMYMKRFIHERRNDAITYYLRNFPENRGDAGAGFRMPYDFVLTSFKGDWFDAARLYREWAIKQIWCSGGPLATRKDVPEWYKKLTFWTLAWEKTHHPNWDDIALRIPEYDMAVKDDLTADGIHKIAKTIGVPYAVQLYGWAGHVWNTGEGGADDYFPPWKGDEGFKKQVKQIQDAGARVLPYTVPLWAKQLDSYKELDVFRYCIKDTAGNSYGWRIDMTSRYERAKTNNYRHAKEVTQPIFSLDWPCPYTEFWQNEEAEISGKLVGDYGADGVYYDVLSGNAQMCYDPNHGHSTGGGNYWAMGNRELLRRSRAAMRKANPDSIMASECPSEVYIDVLDGILLYGSPKAMPGSVPAFQAVYNDYFLLFGNSIGTQEAIDHLPMFAGESFVHGDQLGWFNVWPMFLPEHPRKELTIYWKDETQRKKNVDYLVHIARLKHNSGYKFLTLGEMKHQLVFTNEVPVLEVVQEQRLGARLIPAVNHSVWKAPDGTLGLVFSNGTESAQEVRYTIDVAEYGLSAERNYKVRELQENGASRVVGSYQNAEFSRTETIPARRAIILEIKPE